MTKKEREKAEAVSLLKEWGVKDQTEIYGKVTQVSRSGMSRRIELFAVLDGKMVDISYWAAKATEWGYCDKFPRGIRVGGCGMNMILHTIDTLSHEMGYGSCSQTPRHTTGLIYREL